jgi:hypothetical protein
MAVLGRRGILNLLMYFLFEGDYLAPICHRIRACYSGKYSKLSYTSLLMDRL